MKMKLNVPKRTWIIASIVAVIAIELLAIGWWVYDHNRSKPAPKEATNSQQAAYKTVASLADDLGLKVDDKLGAGLVYVKKDNSFSFSSEALMDKTGGLDGGCGPKWAPTGGIQRYDKAWFSEADSFYTESDVQNMVKSGSAKEFSNYYLIYSGSQEQCSQEAGDLQFEEAQRLKELFSSIRD